MGLSVIMIARPAGARVVAVDIADAALALAQEIGARHTIIGRNTEDVAEVVRQATDGGAYVSLDAVGSPDTCYNSVASGHHVQVDLLVGKRRAPTFTSVAWWLDELGVLVTHGLRVHRYPVLFNMIEAEVLQSF